MDPMSILFPVLSVGGLGVAFGAMLGVASEVFKVEEDPRIGEILEVLPGGTLTGLAKRALRGTPTLALKSPEDLDAARAFIAEHTTTHE